MEMSEKEKWERLSMKMQLILDAFEEILDGEPSYYEDGSMSFKVGPHVIDRIKNQMKRAMEL